jgi:ATP-binding cassette, subfamily B, heavy metal transporter
MPPRHAPDVTPPPPGVKGDLSTLKALFPYLWPAGEPALKARVVAALVSLALAKLASVCVPWVYGKAVDLLSHDRAFVLSALVALLAGYGLLRVAQPLFQELREFFFARVGQRAIRSVALATFRHLHALSLRFHLDRQTGGLTRAIERGTKGIEFLLNFMLFNIIPTLLEILLVCGILWAVFDWRFAAVTFLTICGYIGFTLSFTEWRLKYRRRMNEMDSQANTRAIDSLLNYETVKYFSNEEHEARRYDSALRRYEDAAVMSRTTLSILNVGQGAIIAVGLTLIMMLAGFGIRDGSMSVGDFVMVNTYLMQLYMPLNFLGFVYREIKQSLTDMEAMFRLLGEAREVTDRPGAPDLAPGPGAVVFENVQFGYGPDREILKGISFQVPAGRTVAIVGPSGAGKSTISRLLFRFYDVTGGRIVIDGQDLRAVTQASLRRAIGIVPQDTVLFNDSVYYNIRYGQPDAEREAVEGAARSAHIHEFVASLPEGYETKVGERGLKLSGGEKQRVAIARTILKRPRIFLFDEATSALDSHTESAIQRNLKEISADRTTLVIAHRLSTIVEADEILVLEAGRIVERGRHGPLLAANGTYAAMWREQMRERAADPKDTVPADAVIA